MTRNQQKTFNVMALLLSPILSECLLAKSIEQKMFPTYALSLEDAKVLHEQNFLDKINVKLDQRLSVKYVEVPQSQITADEKSITLSQKDVKYQLIVPMDIPGRIMLVDFNDKDVPQMLYVAFSVQQIIRDKNAGGDSGFDLDLLYRFAYDSRKNKFCMDRNLLPEKINIEDKILLSKDISNSIQWQSKNFINYFRDKRVYSGEGAWASIKETFAQDKSDPVCLRVNHKSIIDTDVKKKVEKGFQGE